MRFYVISESCPNKRIYFSFDELPETRDDIPDKFSLICVHGHREIFTNKDVLAEAGKSQISGALFGGFSFILEPILSLIDIIQVALKKVFKISNKIEEEKIKKFNES